MVSDFKLLGGNLRFSVYSYSTVCHYFLCSLNPFNKMICKPKWKPTKGPCSFMSFFPRHIDTNSIRKFFCGKNVHFAWDCVCMNWWRKVIKHHNFGQTWEIQTNTPTHYSFLPQNTAAKIDITLQNFVTEFSDGEICSWIRVD